MRSRLTIPFVLVLSATLFACTRVGVPECWAQGVSPDSVAAESLAFSQRQADHSVDLYLDFLRRLPDGAHRGAVLDSLRTLDTLIAVPQTRLLIHARRDRPRGGLEPFPEDRQPLSLRSYRNVPLHQEGEVSALDSLRLGCCEDLMEKSSSPIAVKLNSGVRRQLKNSHFVMKPTEVRKVICACANPRDLTLVATLAATGMRRAEVAAPDARDVDLEARRVTIRSRESGNQKTVPITEERALTVCAERPCHVTTLGPPQRPIPGIRVHS